MEVLRTYGRDLERHGGRLAVVTDSDRVERQLRLGDVVAPDLVYRSTTFIGEATRRSVADGAAWIDAQRADP